MGFHMQKQRSPKYPMRISIHSIKKKKTEPHRNDANSIVLWKSSLIGISKDMLIIC